MAVFFISIGWLLFAVTSIISLRDHVDPLRLWSRWLDTARAACYCLMLCWQAARREWVTMWEACVWKAQSTR